MDRRRGQHPPVRAGCPRQNARAAGRFEGEPGVPPVGPRGLPAVDELDAAVQCHGPEAVERCDRAGAVGAAISTATRAPPTIVRPWWIRAQPAAASMRTLLLPDVACIKLRLRKERCLTNATPGGWPDRSTSDSASPIVPDTVPENPPLSAAVRSEGRLTPRSATDFSTDTPPVVAGSFLSPSTG